jgi:DNA-binding MarR family transcriptional regulator
MANVAETTEIAVDPMRNLLGYHLRQVSAASMATLAVALSKYGLTPTAASVLLVIFANPEARQSAVGRHLSIKRANIAPVIASLEAQGYLARTPIDGRSHGLLCTRSGALLAGRVKKTFEEHEARVFGLLTESARQKLVGQFQEIHAEINKQETFD